MEPDRIERFRETLREAGVRITRQRIEIYREVIRKNDHPDVETIRKRLRGRMPNISHDTVYRALSLFARLGLIQRVDTGMDRARYDANEERHHHFLCRNCGTILDFTAPDPCEGCLPREAGSLGRVERIRLEVHGVCAKCDKTTT